MGRSGSIAASALAAALLTHGMVYSGLNLDGPLPASTYQGFFQHLLLAAERLWSYAHGWQPMSHIRDFGRFYAPAVQLLCPLIGFALFRIISRHKVGLQWWKPVTIALLVAVLPDFSAFASRDATPWVEVARTILVVVLMLWSVGAPAMFRRKSPAEPRPRDLTRRRAPAWP
jgi:hypothetical protein